MEAKQKQKLKIRNINYKSPEKQFSHNLNKMESVK